MSSFSSLRQLRRLDDRLLLYLFCRTCFIATLDDCNVFYQRSNARQFNALLDEHRQRLWVQERGDNILNKLGKHDLLQMCWWYPVIYKESFTGLRCLLQWITDKFWGFFYLIHIVIECYFRIVDVFMRSIFP